MSVFSILSRDGRQFRVPFNVKQFAALPRDEQAALLSALDDNLKADERAARAKRWTFCPARYASQHAAFHEYLAHFTANTEA
jgi:hypothetical protein